MSEKNSTETTQKQHRNNTENLSESEQKILENISINPFITSKELSKIVGITADNIRVNISKLKAKGLLERIGGAKGGYWKIK
jgi:ATP-dependent DNA helicase RecG